MIDFFWLLFCVYILFYIENFFVGMLIMKLEISFIMRYNIKDFGLKIKFEIIGWIENWFFFFLIDNINGDIIVVYFYMC